MADRFAVIAEVDESIGPKTTIENYLAHPDRVEFGTISKLSCLQGAR